MPGCTDYSRFSLDQLWDMVSPIDTISQGQIENWLQMAALCDDQADSLAAALSRLNEHWPPAPNSASARFSSEITGVVSAMQSNASEARDMSLSLSDIVAALDSAKSQMQPLMDQQARFRQMSSVSPDLTTVLVDFFTNHSEGPPAGWQDDLHTQATGILGSADARLETIAAKMVTVTRFSPPALEVGPQGPETRRTQQPSLPQAGGPSLGGVPGVPPGISHFSDNQFATTQAGPDTALTTLAGSPTSAPLVPGSPAMTFGTAPGATTPLFASGQSIQRTAGGDGLLTPPIAPTNGGLDNPAGSEGSSASFAGSPDGNEVAGQTSSGSPMMSPGMAGRPATAGGRSAARPGGRAALWASQRQQKRDRKDPWAVKQGIPAVIEPAPEPVEHDPGPGVIGLDA
jgi:hypothetical protein